MPPSNEREAQPGDWLWWGRTSIHLCRGLQRPSAVARLTWQIAGDRSGTVGMRQMAACVSPGPSLAACRRTKIASFFSEQNCCDGSFEGGVGRTCARGHREGGFVRSGLRAKSRSSSFPLRAAVDLLNFSANVLLCL